MKTTLLFVERHHSVINGQANGLLKSGEGSRYGHTRPSKVQTKTFISVSYTHLTLPTIYSV